MTRECKDCWHNYHCPMPQEGYNYNPDTCPYNSDNKRENYDTGRKQQLIKDLCARLLYNPYIFIEEDNIKTLLTSIEIDKDGITKIWYDGIPYCIEDIKPYLRPIKSMTQKECDELFRILNIDEDNGDWLKINDIGVIRLFTELGKDFYEIADAIDYLNSIHIDYRGLIPMELALEAPEGMYKTE